MDSTRSQFTSFRALSLGACASLAFASCGEPPATEATGSELTSHQSALAIAGDLPAAPTSTSATVRSGPITLPPPVQTPPPSVPLGYTALVLPFTPAGINDSGVVGGAQVGNIVSWNNGVTTIFPVPPDIVLAVSGGAINNAGSVIGQAQNRGLVWIRPVPPDCTTTDCMLPIEFHAPNSAPLTLNAINDSNVVVGSFQVPASTTPFSPTPQQHAFQWSPTGGFRDITPRGWLSAVATDINDAGEISGYGVGPDLVSQFAIRLSTVDGRPPLAILSPLGEADAIANTGRTAGPGEGGVPEICTVPTTTTPSRCVAITATSAPRVPAPTSVEDLADTARIVGVGSFGTDHPNKPWTAQAGTVTWLPVPADNGNTISDVFSHLRVNTCGSIVGTQDLQFMVGSTRVLETQGFLWTKPSCDPAPPAIFTLPPGTVTATTSTTISGL